MVLTLECYIEIGFEEMGISKVDFVSLRKEIIQLSHSGMTGGHFGLRKTLAKLQRRDYWVGWRDQVYEVLKRCTSCACYRREKPLNPSTLSQVIVEKFFLRYGLPLQIVTDQGPNFESQLFRDMCQRLEIDNVRTINIINRQPMAWLNSKHAARQGGGFGST